MTIAEHVVDVTGLAKDYAGRRVIEDVTLTLAPGEMIGLVGANGGGKTTTLRMLASLLRPDAGSGTVHGLPLGDRRLRYDIGYMTQRPALYPDLDVIENLRFRAAAHGVARPADCIAEVAENYGITDVLRTRVSALSGGWVRRVQFAATMIHAPRLLLLDEPTAGLDAATRRDIWGWLAALATEGCSIVVSTHDLVEAERCPAILHYHDGRAEGPLSPATLIAQSGQPTLEAAIVAQADSR